MPHLKYSKAFVWFAGLLALTIVIFIQVQIAAAQAETPAVEPGSAPMGNQIEQGAVLYADNCAVCHGEQGAGRVGATLAKDWPSIRPDMTVRAIIAQGVRGSPMPAWSNEFGGPLSDAEIDALVQYILSWQTGGAPVFSPAPTATLIPELTPVPQVEGNISRGAVLFGENCDMCHGPNGAGRVGATLAKDWGGIRPDLSVRTTIANGIAGSAMPAWSTDRGGPLGDTEINDLTAFVLALGESGQVVQVSPVAPDPNNQIPPTTAAQEWAGVVLFLVLFAAIVAGAVLLQRRSA